MDDVVAIVDSTGTVVTEYTYSPWGEVTSVTGSNVTLGELNPFRYRSYYYDSDIEMYYLQSRYYDPEICRFINCDDVNYIGATGSAMSYDPFAYCENDPVNMIDPSGSFAVTVGVSVYLAGALIKYTVACLVVFSSYAILVNSGLIEKLLNCLANCISCIGNSIKSNIDSLKKAISQAVEKAKTKTLTNKTEKHHIIPKGARSMGITVTGENPIAK